MKLYRLDITRLVADVNIPAWDVVRASGLNVREHGSGLFVEMDQDAVDVFRHEYTEEQDGYVGPCDTAELAVWIRGDPCPLIPINGGDVLDQEPVGSRSVAEQIAVSYFHDVSLPPGIEDLGSGTHRIVYVDRAAGVIYKIGTSSANRQEVRTLTGLRERGIEHAPPATIYRIDAGPYYGWCTIVAMPYLPDDGSVPRPYPLLEGAGDLNGGNVHANGGRLWLIDAGGL